MISAPDQLKPEEVPEVLARAAAQILPNPHVDDRPPTTTDEKATVLMRDLREHLAKKGSPQEVNAEVRRILTDRLTQPYLTDNKLPEIKARLADRGLLSKGDYEIVFDPSYVEFHNFLQVRRNHIIEAIQHPSAVQRLEPSDLGLAQRRFPQMSLYLKEIDPPKKDPYYLLFQCVHQTHQLIVGNVWRIYKEDINRPDDSSPLALLRAFVRTFGLMFSVDGSPLEQFILYKVFPRLNSAGPPEIRIKDGGDKQYVQCWFGRGGELNVAEVQLAYVIDLDAYLPTQTRRGHPIAVPSRGTEGYTHRSSGNVPLDPSK